MQDTQVAKVRSVIGLTVFEKLAHSTKARYDLDPPFVYTLSALRSRRRNSMSAGIITNHDTKATMTPKKDKPIEIRNDTGATAS